MRSYRNADVGRAAVSRLQSRHAIRLSRVLNADGCQGVVRPSRYRFHGVKLGVEKVPKFDGLKLGV